MDLIGIKVGVVSYDDFYLTNKEQNEVSKSENDNIYLQGRGVAGTHDMELGQKVINDMVTGKD